MSFDDGLFMVSYVISVVKSWIYWPIIAGAIFLKKFGKQRAEFEKENPGQVAMAWPITEQVPVPLLLSSWPRQPEYERCRLPACR